MPVLKLETEINAPVAVCFDLARSIDLHVESMIHSRETAIAGVTTGLIGLNETVTWRAKHFGVFMELTSKITEYRFPERFCDIMIKGPFRIMKHSHLFEIKNNRTLMTDEFEFVSPFGMLGRLADSIFLTRYMRNLLETRNHAIKTKAEAQAGAR